MKNYRESINTKERVLEYLKSNIITIFVSIFLSLIFITGNSQVFMYSALFIGIFYGFMYVRILIFTRGYTLGSALALFLLPFIAGGFIGIFVLSWRIIKMFIGLVLLIVYLMKNNVTTNVATQNSQ